MKVFPVTASTLSANELGTFVREKYGLNEKYICRLFRTGINHTYFVSDNDTKYVLRVYSYNWRSKSEITEEIRLLNLFRENNLSISFPIQDNNGEFIQSIMAPEGKRYAVLFSFAHGGKTRFMDKETCFSIGVLMSRIHSLTLNQKIDRITYNSETLLSLPYRYAKSFFSETLKEMEFIKKTSEGISKSFQKTDLTKVQNGILHLDIWYDNMSVTEEKEVTLFDFDFCGNGWLICDLAYFCKQLFHIENDKKEYELKTQSFLDGYQSIRQLSEEELALIPKAGAAVWIFYLGVQCQRFDWSNIFLTENYLKMYAGKIRSWIDYHDTQK